MCFDRRIITKCALSILLSNKKEINYNCEQDNAIPGYQITIYYKIPLREHYQKDTVRPETITQ